MKQVYRGNIDNISAIVDKINNERKYQFFPTNEITHAKLNNNSFVISGLVCKAVGKLQMQNGYLNIDLKVRLKRQFIFIGLFVLFFISGIILGEKVTINGDSDPNIWERIGFASILFVIFFLIPVLVLMKLRFDFEKKVENLIK